MLVKNKDWIFVKKIRLAIINDFFNSVQKACNYRKWSIVVYAKLVAFLKYRDNPGYFKSFRKNIRAKFESLVRMEVIVEDDSLTKKERYFIIPMIFNYTVLRSLMT